MNASATLLSCLCTLGFIINLSDYIKTKDKGTLYLACFNLACVVIAFIEILHPCPK
jgi:hypothetical protein